jgi:hypothetical protein
VVKRNEILAKGDQYVFVGLAGSQKAIVSYHVGKRDSDSLRRGLAIFNNFRDCLN